MKIGQISLILSMWWKITFTFEMRNVSIFPGLSDPISGVEVLLISPEM